MHAIAQTLRIHQWAKNVLIFVPFIAAHSISDLSDWLILFLAFISFSLGASATYVINDLLDLENDRLHPRKKNRPIASGRVSARIGFLLIPFLLAASIGIGAFVNSDFLLVLFLYLVVTIVYSKILKQMVLVDVVVLAVLYTVRLVAGAAAIQGTLTFWMLTFSIFLFMSLAFVKRFAELELWIQSGGHKLHGRGYHTDDAALIQTMGISAGYASVLVFAMYLRSEEVVKLYETPGILWGAVLMLLFWINWMWFQAHRANMHDDPLVFAVKDRVSLFVGAVFAIFLALAAVGWAW